MASGVNFGTQQYFGFNPLTVPNCQLWLDGADTTTTLQALTITYNAFVTTTAATVTYSGTLTSVNNFYGGTVVMNGANIGAGGGGSTPVSGLWAPSATSGRWYSYVNDGSFNKAVLCEFVLTGSTLTVRGISAGFTSTTGNFLNANSSGAVNDTRYATYNAATIATSSTTTNYGVQSFVMNTGGGTGTTVALWRDKSGNGRNATGYNNPTYVSSAINTVGGISLTSQQHFRGTPGSFITSNSMTTFAVATTTVALPRSGSDQRLVSFSTDSSTRDYDNTASVIALFNQTTSSTIGTYRNGWVASNAIAQNTPFMAVSLYNGANGFVFFNGSAGSFTGTASSGNFNVGAYGIGNAANNTTEYWNGFVGEVITYNRSLTSNERQTVEGYLAWKWRLTANLPTTHPFKRNPPAMRLFEPVDVLDCAIWVDPADRSSILTLSGNQPTSIRSKGHQTITLDNAQPVNNAGASVWTSWPPPGVTNYGTQFMTNSSSNLNTLQFTQTSGSGGAYGNGQNGSYLRIPSLTFSNQQRTIFFVYSPQSTGANSYAHMFAPTNWSGTTNLRQRGYSDYGLTQYVMFPVTAGGTQELVAGNVAPYTGFMPTNGTPYIFAARHTTSTASNYTSVNGNQLTSGTNQALTTGYLTGTDEYVIGIFFAYARQFLMGDFLLYDGAIQESEIRQIEGYLAWKWGLRASLPTTHPFRNFPPATVLFVPTFFTNCALWLDAADRTSFVLSGSSVTTWNDKSGNGRNAANQNTAGVLVDGVQNQLSVLRLAGVNNYAITYPSFPNTAYTVFTVQYLSTTTGYGRVLQNENNPAGSAPGLFIGVGSDGTSIATFTGPGSGWNDVDINSPGRSNLTTWRIVTTWVSGSTLTPYVDGTAQANKVGTTRAFSNLNIGSYPNSPPIQAWNGDIGEIIIYSSALTTAQRQRVEGYLAWKWGLRANLPVAHPYYKFRP
jgi:hypothetical protein